MLGVFFPTKYEAEDFLASLEKVKEESCSGIEVFRGYQEEKEVLVAIIGIGVRISASRVRVVLDTYPFHTVVLAGFAGALNPDLKRGDVLVVKPYSSEDVVNFLRLLPGFSIAHVYTSPELVTTAAQKAELAREKGCQLVDMETEAVAGVLDEFDVEFLCVRVISDLYDEDLPAKALALGYSYEEGRPTPVRFALGCLLQPYLLPGFFRFLKTLPEVRKSLTAFLVAAVKDL